MLDILILLVLVAGIVLVTARWKVSPVLALLGAALLGAFAYRIPVADIVTTITTAFGGTLGNIGLVILFGTMIGVLLERSGAAIAMAEALIRLIGTRFPTLTMTVIGFFVSIPVFCDSGYVILNSLRKAITLRTGVSTLATSVALMTGLYATHTLVPPTPGPLAAASNLGVENLGLLIGIGLPVAAVAALAGMLYANRFLHTKLPPITTGGDDMDTPEAEQTYEELRAGYGRLPHAFAAFMPILVPLLLICFGSIAKLPGRPFGEGVPFEIIGFVGTPVIALMLGLVVAASLLRGNGKLDTFNSQIDEAIRVSAPILLITAAGAAFGAVLAASPLMDVLGDSLSGLGIGLAVPFLIAAALKTAQGSSTVAMVTTSALVAPLLDSIGLGSTMGATLSVLAVGAGAMVVSHANDSYFWVVSRLSGIPVATAYRSLTVATAIEGTAAFAAIYVLGLFLL
ncbi:H+/gluconate symporter family protein [Sanguibacter keddieii DSM 10542]|uniref:H+/gluconate symporter family protein n=1 Tax=Sanguibacter keddieii (strain ATCC 51767 / DSM 10542 / NCFB 3025 / ST-74) TaxID=446469 RepID=D1BKQ4_SANKS|nr:GntP family permease [Sanguibacter keddieii]ACZ22531.1 H+/gluconate symporter family protein [Sanguibacter keddieii DSM 10542]